MRNYIPLLGVAALHLAGCEPSTTPQIQPTPSYDPQGVECARILDIPQDSIANQLDSLRLGKTARLLDEKEREVGQKLLESILDTIPGSHDTTWASLRPCRVYLGRIPE